MAVDALVPLSVAVSVTAVLVGTLMLVPLCAPPESEVDTDVGRGVVTTGADPSPGFKPVSTPLPKSDCGSTLNGAENRWGKAKPLPA